MLYMFLITSDILLAVLLGLTYSKYKKVKKELRYLESIIEDLEHKINKMISVYI